MVRQVVLITFVLFLPACVTTHSGKVTKSALEDLNISCSVYGAFSDEYYDVVGCTLENTSEDWLTVSVDSVDVEFGSENYEFLDPGATRDYLYSKNFDVAKNDHNLGLALVAVALGASAANQSGTAGAVSGSAVKGANGVVLAKTLSDAHGSVQYAYADEHLLGGDIRIPASLFVRKSFIVQKKSKDNLFRNLSVCTKLPRKECYQIKIKRFGNNKATGI